MIAQKLADKLKNKFCEVRDLQEAEIQTFKNRINFVCLLCIVVTAFIFVSDHYILKLTYSIGDHATVVIAFAICGIFMGLIRKVKKILPIKLMAFSLITVFLFLIAWGDILQGTEYPAFLIGYIMAFLIAALVIPWMPMEVIGLFVVTLTVFTLFFFFGNFFREREFQILCGKSQYMEGVSLLVTCFIVCFMARHYEVIELIKKNKLDCEIKEKNRQMERELELATRVHNRLIPHSLSSDLVDIAVSYLPMSYIGGDYAKFHFVNKNRLIFIICDVTGHGVSSALLVNAVNGEFERLAKESKMPGELLKEMDGFIKEEFEGTNMYLTAFCGLLDFGFEEFLFSNYGHPPQYIYKTIEKDIVKIGAQTSFLGLPIVDNTEYQGKLSFKKNDQILLFTDGATEAKDEKGTEYGSNKLETFIKKNSSLGVDVFNKKLLQDLNSFASGGFQDDVFILNIKVK